MVLARFLEQLFQGEPLTVASSWNPPSLAEGDEQAEAVLRTRHEADMLELAGAPLAFEAESALWAARRTYQVAQAFRLRDVDEDSLQMAFGPAPRIVPRPEVVHAVDLSFRFLPGILDLARGLAPGDALVGLGRGLLEPWPLSSVGVVEVKVPEDRVKPILDHFGLRTRYLDRIFAKRDFGRLANLAVAAHARRAVGAYRDLVPRWNPSTLFSDQT